MNKMFRLGLSQRSLMERGVRLGADVPYCIMRGTVLAEGIGEELTTLPALPACTVLIAKPPISVSTKVVYEALDAKEIVDHPDIDGIIRGWRRGLFPRLPLIWAMCWRMLRLGCIRSLKRSRMR